MHYKNYHNNKLFLSSWGCLKCLHSPPIAWPRSWCGRRGRWGILSWIPPKWSWTPQLRTQTEGSWGRPVGKNPWRSRRETAMGTPCCVSQAAAAGDAATSPSPREECVRPRHRLQRRCCWHVSDTVSSFVIKQPVENIKKNYVILRYKNIVTYIDKTFNGHGEPRTLVIKFYKINILCNLKFCKNTSLVLTTPGILCTSLSCPWRWWYLGLCLLMGRERIQEGDPLGGALAWASQTSSAAPSVPPSADLGQSSRCWR